MENQEQPVQPNENGNEDVPLELDCDRDDSDDSDDGDINVPGAINSMTGDGVESGNGATEMEIESNQGSTNGEDGEAPSQQNGVHP